MASVTDIVIPMTVSMAIDTALADTTRVIIVHPYQEEEKLKCIFGSRFGYDYCYGYGYYVSSIGECLYLDSSQGAQKKTAFSLRNSLDPMLVFPCISLLSSRYRNSTNPRYVRDHPSISLPILTWAGDHSSPAHISRGTLHPSLLPC